MIVLYSNPSRNSFYNVLQSSEKPMGVSVCDYKYYFEWNWRKVLNILKTFKFFKDVFVFLKHVPPEY
jgi:hypothetical protein